MSTSLSGEAKTADELINNATRARAISFFIGSFSLVNRD
jgi:hypothetical protein